MPPRVRQAVVLALIFNGILILTGLYRSTYDAYTHMLFADHYRTHWWSLWDPRWYTGFEVNSYPPLVHQIIALFSLWMGVDAGYAVLLWIVLAAFPLAVYGFSHVFVSRSAAGYAALGAAFLPSIFLSAYTFGQLPTLTSTLFALFCGVSLAEFLRSGSRLSGLLAVLLVAVVIGSHHGTMLFLPWIFLAVVLHLLINRQVKLSLVISRLAVFGLFGFLAGRVVIWPFWQWGMGQTMQTAIDHSSRHNFLTDSFAAFLFFWSPYGPLTLLIPFALWKGFNRRFTSLAIVFFALLLLGLGGTTSIPAWLFGENWAWLTYDRFTLWASLLLLPFLGTAMILVRRRLQPFLERVSKRSIRISISTGAYCLLAATCLLVSLYPFLIPTQPKPLDMQPIVDFLANGNRSNWRYLTFGFGDQFALLNRLTTATTIDGSYHTARNLPELRTSGIGQIDSTYWLPGGLEKLGPVLQHAGLYGVRWGFVDLPAYSVVLKENGWIEIGKLSNGVYVWENPGAIRPTQSAPPKSDPLKSASWGTLPLLALATTAAASGLRLKPALTQKALLAIHSFTVGLLPIGLIFWYFHNLTSIDYSRVYLIYDNVIVFLPDVLGFIAVLAWILARWFGPYPPQNSLDKKGLFSLHEPFKSPSIFLFGLCVLATLSSLWSKYWRESLYISLQFWLVFGLYLSLRDRPETWRSAAYGFCAALVLEVFIGAWEYAVQSTKMLAVLKMNWPGTLVPSMRGVSVVQLLDGTRFLRVYGTLPHPNILGTFLIALFAGPVTLFMTSRKRFFWAGILFAGGLALLVITFSRGAWIGFLAGALVLALKFRSLDRKRLLILGIVGVVSLVAAVLPVRDLIFTRVAETDSVSTEEFSLQGRTWLTEQALLTIKRYPILGTGIGAFVLDLSQRAPVGYIVEPVHDLPLLAVSELGFPGALILVGLGIVVIRNTRLENQPVGVLLSAALVGLCVTSLFDHSLWTLAPGRMLLGFLFGLWAGQIGIKKPYIQQL